MELETLGNKLVHFVGLDPNWALILNRRWDSVLVNVNFRKGLFG